MVKKFFALLIAFALCGNCYVRASDSKADLSTHLYIMAVAPYIVEEDDYVERGRCVTTIMKMIGVDWETAIALGYYTDYYEPPFEDVTSVIDENCGYIYAAKLCSIANGTLDKHSRRAKFEPYKKVTMRETLAFLLRCMEEPNSLLWENTIDDSVKYGLLNKDELETYNFDAPMRNKEFYILLCRMIGARENWRDVISPILFD